ncbi:LysR substrate-binding domain-containing protein [Streptomyces sp. NPDC047525]|uniref:LysR substrate-binding domain-containing protein n=1 Tax=Streptomyces sp. NPDC047525 TaxID=3155264 RepID=UPI003407F822
MPDHPPTPLLTHPVLSASVPRASLVRLGHTGSADIVTRILRLARRDASTVRITEYDITDPFWLLRAGELDVMVAKFGVREPDLVSSRVLTQDARAAVVGAHHPLARCSSVSVEDVADFPVLDRPDLFPAEIWDEVVPRHTPSGLPLRRAYRLTGVPELMRLLTASTAVHLSVLSVADVAPPTVRVLPVHDLPPASVTLVWRRGDVPAQVLEFVVAAEAGAAQ